MIIVQGRSHIQCFITGGNREAVLVVTVDVLLAGRYWWAAQLAKSFENPITNGI